MCGNKFVRLKLTEISAGSYLIFAVFFSSGKTEEGNVIFSTFVTILGNTRDWKSIDLKFYLFIVSYCLYSKARLLFLEENIKNVIFYLSDDGNSMSASSGFSRRTWIKPLKKTTTTTTFRKIIITGETFAVLNKKNSGPSCTKGG